MSKGNYDHFSNLHINDDRSCSVCNGIHVRECILINDSNRHLSTI